MHLRRRILVTGGAGFIGSFLCETLLSRGYEVLCVDNFFTGTRGNIESLIGQQRFELIRHDVTFPLYIEADDIYNLACPASPIHYPQPESYWGNVNPIGPRACYDEGKRCAETLFFDYYRQHRLRIKVARIFNTYGPRMHPNDGRVVSNFIVQALRNKPITVFGDGSQTRSFCYVDDLVDGLVRLMDSPDDLTGPVNLGNPSEFTIRQLAEKVVALTGSRSKIESRPLPADDPKQRQPDIALARSALKWAPRTQLDEGLKKTIAYFDATLAEIPEEL
jgi:UDP-glucuronate decarboxylase